MALKCRECQKTKPASQFVKVAAAGPLEEWNLRKKCRGCIHQEYLDRRANPKRRKAMTKASNNWKKNNPERHAELAKEYRARHPEKIIAQNRLNYAIRKGNVVRQPCDICGASKKVHAHHRTYRQEDWYNVKWLCVDCHKIEHTTIPTRIRKARVKK